MANIIRESNKDFIRISVVDNGCGLTKEEQNSLFLPFKMIKRNQNLNINGSGLGLTIVKEICQQLNLNIKINSIINTGTTFFFDLPIKKKQIQFKAFLKLKSKAENDHKLISNPILFIDNLFLQCN